MRNRQRPFLLALVLASGCLAGGARADEPTLFTGRAAPVLRQHCVQCHNPVKLRGGLDLTTAAGLVKGGAGGAVVVPGNAVASRLVQMVSGPEPRMPKQGARLTPEEVADLRRWIDAGAPWPKTVTLLPEEAKPRVGPDWWSLRPLVRPAPPTVKDAGWVRTPVDAFVLAALEAKGMHPSPPADRRTLIRRVTFDLLGLPPTPAEVEEFVTDPRPDAYERLVERLLASPHYGERWGRHWLDVAHYGDTHGYDKDKRRDHAWPYRDYVIRAFNADKPYGRFIREQIAGDVFDPENPDALVATGFLAAGPWDFVGHVELREGTVEKEKTRLLDRDDMVSTTVGTFVSLTAHCARCHDHKFDPIPQRDYYRLQAVFAGVDRGDRPYGSSGGRASGNKVYAPVPRAPRPIHVLHRGDVEQPREEVGAGGLSCVPGLESAFRLPHPDDEGSRRAALAGWLADPRNVLTWRSVVNRVWHYHLGRGIADTPNDFGWNGSRPTHPELLAWLAVTFRDGGGSFKRLHRLIVLSATYRQASANNAAFAKLDADNRYLWRTNRTRLDAEEVRDAVQAVSGALDRKMGGPGFELFRFKDDHSPVYDHSALDRVNDPATWRRTVYRFTVRSVPNPFLECLDGADPNLTTPVRSTTITALQALALLNDPFMIRQAACFADRLRRASADPGGQVEAAYRLALGRPPTAAEREALAGYAERHGLTNACLLLFNANEFVFID
jgi:mono/diheme cytochrome c family protein